MAVLRFRRREIVLTFARPPLLATPLKALKAHRRWLWRFMDSMMPAFLLMEYDTPGVYALARWLREQEGKRLGRLLALAGVVLGVADDIIGAALPWPVFRMGVRLPVGVRWLGVHLFGLAPLPQASGALQGGAPPGTDV